MNPIDIIAEFKTVDLYNIWEGIDELVVYIVHFW